MSEKPILFSTPMIRAILAGQKTQTRRIVKWPVRVNGLTFYTEYSVAHALSMSGAVLDELPRFATYSVGDILWVRETWAAQHRFDHLPPRKIPVKTNIHYAATEELGGLVKRPSIYMPRWASRITLEVTHVRVERVQDVSEQDALAEGVDRINTNLLGYAQERFKRLWDSINAKRGFGWEKNPWVWVYEFKVIPKL